MIRNHFFLSAAMAIISMVVAPGMAAAQPVVRITDPQNNVCVVTPSTGTVFTLSAQGDVLINGSYTSGNCSSGSGLGGDPTFAPFSPAPADLTVLPSTLSSAGGNVTPAFAAYFANTCTGKVTATAGCPAIPAPWGTGGTVCNFQTNAKGQKYCQPSGTVAVPNNPSTSNACVYQFQAINCTNGTTSVNSQLATVTVPALVIGSCTDGDHSGELGALGYGRQCSGNVHSFNLSLSPHWTSLSNQFADIMSAPWPGAAAQYGYGLAITVNANGFGSFKFNTGGTAAGIHFESNSSYGVSGLISISTTPGDYFPGSTALCFGSTLNISSKAGTLATCKLSLNTDYYINVSNADYSSPHATDCTTSSCTTGWTVYGYGN
jgi:hypothetical protein